MSEKRRVHRLSVSLPASFKISEKQSHISVATTLNISAIGLCFKTKEKLKVSQEIGIRVKVPTGEVLTIQTEVVWVKEADFFKNRDYLVGVKIAQAMKADEAKFVKYFAEQLAESGMMPPP